MMPITYPLKTGGFNGVHMNIISMIANNLYKESELIGSILMDIESKSKIRRLGDIEYKKTYLLNKETFSDYMSTLDYIKNRTENLYILSDLYRKLNT